MSGALNKAAEQTSAWKVHPREYAAARPPQFEAPVHPESVYVQMADGVRLAADIYLPSRAGETVEGEFPTIMVLTPYYRRFKLKPGSDAEPTPGNSKYRDLFVSRGYALVVVDVRGTGASFGHREGFRAPHERKDFSDLADWVCAQRWSNGRIGAGGISYLGAGAEFLAGTGHPAVKAIAPLFAVWDTYADNYYPGGVQLTELIESYHRVMLGLDQVDEEALAPYPAYQHPEFAGGPQPVDEDEDGKLLEQALADHRANYRHTDLMRQFSFREEPLPYDPSYSSAAFSPYHYSHGVAPDVAILSLSGWMDGAGYANGALSRFLVMKDNPHHLMLGPWDHGARTDVSPWRAAEAPDDFWWFEVLRFFDHYLCGMQTGLDQEEPVHYFTLHEEQWHSAPAWPLAQDASILELTEHGSLSREPASPETLEYQVDYGLGAGKRTRYERIAAHAVDDYYADWHGRTHGHLSFTSEALEQSLTLSGHGQVELTISSSEPDAQVFVYLTEEEADGTQRYVTEGLLRLLHRKVTDPPQEFPDAWPFRTFRREDAEPLTVGRPEKVLIPMLPTSWRFNPGSRIVLSIAGHDRDHTAQSPQGRPPRLTLHTGPGANLLELPIVLRK